MTETEIDKLPPDRDFNKWIRDSHLEAEMLRLRMGMDGCGCSQCQEFYQTLDLSRYGARVILTGGLVMIMAGQTGADMLKAKDDPQTPDQKGCEQPHPCFNNGAVVTEGYNSPGEINGGINETLKRGPGRPRKEGGTLSRTTQWRRGQEAQRKLQGALV